jgi:hypothetical protein
MVCSSATLFISQSRKGKALFKCNRVIKLVWIQKGAAMPIAPPLNSAEEFQ